MEKSNQPMTFWNEHWNFEASSGIYQKTGFTVFEVFALTNRAHRCSLTLNDTILFNQWEPERNISGVARCAVLRQRVIVVPFIESIFAKK